MVTVLMISALVIIMATVLLTLVLLNYYTKVQNTKNQKNFYNAESAMEEVRMGLVTEASQSAALAYSDTLSQYGDLAESERMKTFQKIFFQEMQKKLQYNNNRDYYDCDLLDSYISDELKNAGAKFETRNDEIDNKLDDKTLEAGERCLLLHNVKVSFQDAEGNYSEIETDIEIKYPQIDFGNASSLTNLLCYALIAGEDTQNGERLSVILSDPNNRSVDATVYGNAYLGTGLTRLTGQNTNLTFAQKDKSKSYVIGGDVRIRQHSSLTLEQVEAWLQNLVVQTDSGMTTKGSSLFLQNDIVLEGEDAVVTLDGDFYGFGNPAAMESSTCYQENIKHDKLGKIQDAFWRNPADFSSSIIINGGAGTKADLSKVNNFMIAGTAYINANKPRNTFDGNNKQLNSVANKVTGSVKTGQSVMTISDQRAYLVPADLVGKGFEHGGANPMTADMWKNLREEMEQKGLDFTENLVDMEASSSELGTSLSALGVNRWDVTAIQTAGTSMFYLFMHFEDQQSENAFVKSYYSMANHAATLRENLQTYSGDKADGQGTYIKRGGVTLPSEKENAMRFYMQGNAISSQANRLLISDTLMLDADGKEAGSILEREAGFMDSYAGLLANLEKKYEALSTAQKRQILFDNLFDEGQSVFSNIKNNSYFVSEDGVGALVGGKDVVVSDAVKKLRETARDKNGNKHGDATLHLIITKGTVTVDQDFDGLIIAEKTITIEGGCKKIAQNPAKVYEAFVKSKTSGGQCPRDFLDTKTGYAIVGDEDEEDAADRKEGKVSLSDTVAYCNWEKH